MTPFNALSVTTALVITGSLSAAHATPDDLDGRYAVECDSIDIPVGLQDFEFTAADGSVRLTTPESHTLSFDGRIDREAGYTLDADYFADLSLLCDVADEGEAARVGRLGLTVRANVVGVRE